MVTQILKMAFLLVRLISIQRMGENGREAKAVLQSGALSVINGCECDPELDGGPLYTGGHIQKPVKRRHTQTTYTHAAETV